jgi:hypothetical protein
MPPSACSSLPFWAVPGCHKVGRPHRLTEGEAQLHAYRVRWVITRPMHSAWIFSAVLNMPSTCLNELHPSVTSGRRLISSRADILSLRSDIQGSASLNRRMADLPRRPRLWCAPSFVLPAGFDACFYMILANNFSVTTWHRFGCGLTWGGRPLSCRVPGRVFPA